MQCSGVLRVVVLLQRKMLVECELRAHGRQIVVQCGEQLG